MAPTVLAGQGSAQLGDEECKALEVKDIVIGMDRLQRALGVKGASLPRTRKYDPHRLLDGLLLGTLLRDRSQLRATVKLSLSMGVPTAWQDIIGWTDRTNIMSKSSVTRAQRIVDTAYMHWWRHDWQQRGPRYYFGLVDSSTQGHKAVDWLNSQMHYVLKTDLIKVYDAWRFLVGLVDSQHQAFAAAPTTATALSP